MKELEEREKQFKELSMNASEIEKMNMKAISKNMKLKTKSILVEKEN